MPAALQNFPMLGETNNQFYLALLKGLYIFYYLRTRKFIGIVFHNWFTGIVFILKSMTCLLSMLIYHMLFIAIDYPSIKKICYVNTSGLVNSTHIANNSFIFRVAQR